MNFVPDSLILFRTSTRYYVHDFLVVAGVYMSWPTEDVGAKWLPMFGQLWYYDILGLPAASDC